MINNYNNSHKIINKLLKNNWETSKSKNKWLLKLSQKLIYSWKHLKLINRSLAEKNNWLLMIKTVVFCKF
jgi:hypothetical protein